MATYQVNASTDDCQRKLVTDFFSLTGDNPYAGALLAQSKFGSGYRFNSVAIAQGQTIGTAMG